MRDVQRGGYLSMTWILTPPFQIGEDKIPVTTSTIEFNSRGACCINARGKISALCKSRNESRSPDRTMLFTF